MTRGKSKKPKTRAKDLAKFMIKREDHRLYKIGEKSKRLFKPDPIISAYRFCNVRREDDRVTKWISKNYRARWATDPYLWFALAVARLFNKPTTLEAIHRAVLPFKPEDMRGALYDLRQEGSIFNAAYIVSTNGLSMDKVDYVIDNILKPLWDMRDTITESIKDAWLEDIHYVLSQQNGLGSFLAAQIVADLKYAPPWYSAKLEIPTKHAPDWYSFALYHGGADRSRLEVCAAVVQCEAGNTDEACSGLV
jgi:hypothetical protein